MTVSSQGQRWEPTEAELEAFGDAAQKTDFFPEEDAYLLVIRAVGPLIAARALRAAAADLAGSAAENRDAKGTQTFWGGFVEAQDRGIRPTDGACRCAGGPMTDRPAWEPTEQDLDDLDIALRILGKCAAHSDSELRAALQVVGPSIAARALREAATDSRSRSWGPFDVEGWLTRRAAALGADR